LLNCCGVWTLDGGLNFMAMRRRCAMWTGRRLPDGRPRWLLAPVILASFASGAAAQAQKTRVPPTPSACHVEPFGSGVVARVIDGRTFVLADGREVRLAGIEVPPEADGEAAVGTLRFAHPTAGSEPSTEGAAGQAAPSPDRGRAATEALAALVAGQETVLKRAKPVTDRYGRLLADAYVSRDGAEGSVAKTLLAQGLARVAARPATPPARPSCAPRSARPAPAGLAFGPIRAIFPMRRRIRGRSPPNGGASRWSRARWCRCARAAAPSM